MREIKFRAWYKDKEKFYKHVELIDFENEKIEVFDLDTRTDIEIKLEDAILMQYTGVTDKNGVEIYEGDILENDHYCTGAVEYSDRDASFCMGVFYLKNVYARGKVIGNIYENPELIKEEK